MIKPILIRVSKPVKGEIYPLTELSGYFNDNATCYRIILIDTEAEIAEDDWLYRLDTKQIIQCKAVSDNWIGQAYTGSVRRDLFVKIISATYDLEGEELRPEYDNGNHKGIRVIKTLPQLSLNSIQLLINYYNEFGCMPESVDVPIKKAGRCSECGAIQLMSYVTCNYNGICKGKVLPILKLNEQGEVDITLSKVHGVLMFEPKHNLPTIEADCMKGCCLFGDQIDRSEENIRKMKIMSLAHLRLHQNGGDKIEAINYAAEKVDSSKVEEKTYAKSDIIKVVDDLRDEFRKEYADDIEYIGVWEFVESLREKFNESLREKFNDASETARALKYKYMRDGDTIKDLFERFDKCDL